MATMTLCFVAAGVLLTAVPPASGFYLPGVAPHSFAKDEEVELKVNKLSSVHTQLPYDYYSLKFCKPKGGVKPYSENLGEFLRGDRIENSAYDIAMLQDDYCTVLCQQQLTTKDVTDFKNAIKRQYHHNWIIDNLPAASILDTDQFVTTQYVGFPVGYQDGNSYYLYNHVNIILEYHTVEADGHRIVGFYVEPLSVKHTFSRCICGACWPAWTCTWTWRVGCRSHPAPLPALHIFPPPS